MYYRKYFSGSVDATTTTNQYYMGLDKVATGTSRGSGHIKNRSDVIGNAIVATLKDVGYPNAYWDSTSGYLFFDKTNSLAGIYLSVQNGYMYFNAGYKSTYNYIYASGNTTSGSVLARGFSLSTSSNPFSTSNYSAADYAFYVTIIGEPKGTFSICIGAYTSHAAENLVGTFAVGVDKRDNGKLFGYNFNTSNIFYTAKYSDLTEIGQDEILGYSGLTMKNELVVLIPLFLKIGYAFFDNTYINPQLAEGFYEIDGDTYLVTRYWITKCITSI